MKKHKYKFLRNLIFISSLTLFSVGLNGVEDYDKFILGKSFFTKPWVLSPSSTTARDGLGPLFSANTCISCHPGNGRGNLYSKENITSRSLVARLSTKNSLVDLIYGSQISINGTLNTPFEGKIKIDFKKNYVHFKDGEKVELLKPMYTLKNLNYGSLSSHTNVSYRMATNLKGLGLIEQLKNEKILKNEDEFDRDKDGISGKANYVYSKITKKIELGKYNHKANVAFIKEQVSNAAFDDMGLTSSLNPKDNCTSKQEECLKESSLSKEIDIPDFRIEAISYYIENLKINKNKKDKDYFEGLEIFESISCAKCHITSFTLENGRKIYPYSDFLLHDMGEDLSDGRVEYQASKSEFRTAPLWGHSKHEKINKKTVRLLHDGRARNFQEAILWHGGEALNAKENYMNLEKEKREKLIKFLEKL